MFEIEAVCSFHNKIKAVKQIVCKYFYCNYTLFGVLLLSGKGGRLYVLPSGVIQQVGGSWLCRPILSVTFPALFIRSFAGQHLLKKYQQYHSWLPYAFLYINRNVWFWYMKSFEFPLVFMNIPENKNGIVTLIKDSSLTLTGRKMKQILFLYYYNSILYELVTIMEIF